MQIKIEQIKKKTNLLNYELQKSKKRRNFLEKRQILSQKLLNKIAKMQNLSQNELDQITKWKTNLKMNYKKITKMRRIKSYENMSKEGLLIVLLKSKQSLANLYNKVKKKILVIMIRIMELYGT